MISSPLSWIFEQAKVILTLQEYKTAILHFDEIIKSNPSTEILASTLNGKGLAYLGLENKKEAKQCFQEALHLDPIDESVKAQLKKNIALCEE